MVASHPMSCHRLALSALRITDNRDGELKDRQTEEKRQTEINRESKEERRRKVLYRTGPSLSM